MRKNWKYILLTTIIVLTVAGVYWQKKREHLIKNGIDKTLAKKTDSLYFIHYESSQLVEITGSAVFYNVSLQSDSAQKEMLKKKDNLPASVLNIKVEEVNISGLNVPGFLTKQVLTAARITLKKPLITIIKTGNKIENNFDYNDTIALYKKILGSYNEISADTIEISGGNVLITDNNGKTLSLFENINIELTKFIIDSKHDYQNLISYFIKNIRVGIENIQLPESKNKTRINIENFQYDAIQKTIRVKNISQYKTGNTSPLTDLKNIQIDRLNTNSFILFHQLQAGIIKCGGGMLTIYKQKSNTSPKSKLIQFSSQLISEVQVQGIDLGNTNIFIADPSKEESKPFVLHNVKFLLPDTMNINNELPLSEIIAAANWHLSVGSFSFFSENKIYKIEVNNILINNNEKSANIGNFLVKPQLSKDAFSRQAPYQKDRYDLEFKNISLQEADFKKMIVDNEFHAASIVLSPVINIYNDRTLPIDTSSKLGKYPHQQLQQLNIPLYIKKIQVKNGVINYTERGRKSGMEGTVSFRNIEGTLYNVTNIPSKIDAEGFCVINAQALFMNSAKIKTQWRLPLTQKNSTFIVNGVINKIDAVTLNTLIEPLAMASVKHGEIDKVVFNLTGNNYTSTGITSMIYHNLKIEVLKKKGNNKLDTKKLVTLLANTLIKNNNPQNGNTKKGNIEFEREINKSFFNFLWKSVFNGIKKIAL